VRGSLLPVEVDTINDSAWIAGQGSRGLIVEGRGRLRWSTRHRARYTTAKRARDLLASADLRGYETSVREVRFDLDKAV
jgi:hypothetical protein